MLFDLHMMSDSFTDSETCVCNKIYNFQNLAQKPTIATWFSIYWFNKVRFWSWNKISINIYDKMISSDSIKFWNGNQTGMRFYFVIIKNIFSWFWFQIKVIFRILLCLMSRSSRKRNLKNFKHFQDTTNLFDFIWKTRKKFVAPQKENVWINLEFFGIEKREKLVIFIDQMRKMKINRYNVECSYHLRFSDLGVGDNNQLTFIQWKCMKKNILEN